MDRSVGEEVRYKFCKPTYTSTVPQTLPIGNFKMKIKERDRDKGRVVARQDCATFDPLKLMASITI